MVNDWESAFEACPPYGEGKGAYGPEDTALLLSLIHISEPTRH